MWKGDDDDDDDTASSSSDDDNNEGGHDDHHDGHADDDGGGGGRGHDVMMMRIMRMIIDYQHPCHYCQQYYAIACYEFPSHLSSATIKAGILPTFVKLLSFGAPVGPRTKLPTATSCQLSDVGLSKRLLTWRSLIVPSSASPRRQLSTCRGENGQQLEVSIGLLLSNFFGNHAVFWYFLQLRSNMCLAKTWIWAWDWSTLPPVGQCRIHKIFTISNFYNQVWGDVEFCHLKGEFARSTPQKKDKSPKKTVSGFQFDVRHSWFSYPGDCVRGKRAQRLPIIHWHSLRTSGFGLDQLADGVADQHRPNGIPNQPRSRPQCVLLSQT